MNILYVISAIIALLLLIYLVIALLKPEWFRMPFEFLQIGLFLAVLLLLVKPLGVFMARVTWASAHF